MLIGRFYFKETTSGNLIGEYSHRRSISRIVYAEAATRTTPGHGWIGDCRTTWREDPGATVRFALLKIRQAEGSVSLFRVEWFSETEPANRMFEGEAMECGHTLIGDYTTV